MASAPRIRIESDRIGNKTTVYLVDDDGEARDVTRELHLTGVDMRIRVGELNTAQLHAIVVGGRVEAEVDQLMLRVIGPSRWGQFAWRLRKLWWRFWYPSRANRRCRIADITAIGDRCRRYLRR